MLKFIVSITFKPQCKSRTKSILSHKRISHYKTQNQPAQCRGSNFTWGWSLWKPWGFKETSKNICRYLHGVTGHLTTFHHPHAVTHWFTGRSKVESLFLLCYLWLLNSIEEVESLFFCYGWIFAFVCSTFHM